MTASTAPLAAGAARMRRHRRRQRQGVRHVVFVEIHAELLGALIEKGWLDEVEAENRTIVADVIGDVLDCYGRAALSPDPELAR